jgi:hypothetical protein
MAGLGNSARCPSSLCAKLAEVHNGDQNNGEAALLEHTLAWKLVVAILGRGGWGRQQRRDKSREQLRYQNNLSMRKENSETPTKLLGSTETYTKMMQRKSNHKSTFVSNQR